MKIEFDEMGRVAMQAGLLVHVVVTRRAARVEALRRSRRWRVWVIIATATIVALLAMSF